jgi:hypothetical protein
MPDLGEDRLVGVFWTSDQTTLLALTDGLRKSMTGFVQLCLFSHHNFSVKQTSFIDDQFRGTYVALDNGFSLEHNLVGGDNGTSNLPADRDILRRDVTVDLSARSDSKALTRRDLAGHLPIDTNVSLAADFAFDDGPGTNQVEFFDRIVFQSLSSFRS